MSKNKNIATAEITTKLVQLQSLLSDMSPVMQEIAAILELDVDQAFEHQRNPSTHAKWSDIDEDTKRQREAIGKWPGKILQQSGELASRIVSDYGAKFAAVGVQAGKADDYAAAQLFGDDDRNLPARPYLPIEGLHPSTEKKIIRVLDEVIAQALSV